jgi:repressor LexA
MTKTTAPNLTPRQLQTLHRIAHHLNKNPYSATISELARELKIARTTAFEHIASLREKNLLKGDRRKARSLRLTQKAKALLEKYNNHAAEDDYQNCTETGQMPLLGTVAAGQPIDAIENSESVSLQNCFGNAENVFALQVKGQSMIEEDIRDGDYIICKKAQSANNGQLAVVIVDDNTATLKKFYKEKNRARLQPANKEYQPIYTDNCRIEAVVIGLLRQL